LLVQISKYIGCVALGVMSFLSAKAQDVKPEALPTRPTAEKVVIETPSVAAIDFSAKPAKKAISYNETFGEGVVKTALQYLGVRYASGGTTPRGFDCSGFTSFVYRQSNVNILRSSRSQFTQGTPIASISDLRKGDLVFFGGRGSTRSVGHVGIVTEVDSDGSNFSFVHSSTSSGVRISNSSESYYSRRYIGARRIVEE